MTYYPKGGAKLCREKGLKDRTDKSIHDKAAKLGVKSESVSKWSDEEIALLKKIYPLYGIKGCIDANICRSSRAIARKCEGLGLKKIVTNNWSIKEDTIIKTYYPIGGSSRRGLNRTKVDIDNRAKFWGLTG